jgi:hypothetical protein
MYEEHDELCDRRKGCDLLGCGEHYCWCPLIEQVEDRTRARIEREREQQEERDKLYALATLIREGDEVWVKVDDGDRIFGYVQGKAVRTGPKRTGVAVCGITILDHNARRVSNGIKEINIIELVKPSGTPTY